MRLFSNLKKNRKTVNLSQENEPESMRVLIVDDEIAQVTLLQKSLERAGFTDVVFTTEANQLLSSFYDLKPDILLLDWNVGTVKGSSIISQLRDGLPEDRFFPILVITADDRVETKHEVLSSNANDIITKPFAAAEVVLRVKNLLKIRYLDSLHQQHTEDLEAQVKEQSEQVELAYQEVIVRLGRAAEYRDDVTGKHVWQVANLSKQLALELGMRSKPADLLMRAARLHDVGKIAIPDGILTKAGPLTPAEYEIVKTHTTIGAELLSGGKSNLVQLAEQIALTHHERWDGQGYPQGLKGKDIPWSGRIVALADAYDGLTRDKAFKRACTPEEAIEEIKQERGKQFDPSMVDAFLRLYDKGIIAAEINPKTTLMDLQTHVT